MNEIYYLITIDHEFWTGAWGYKNETYSFRTTSEKENGKRFYDIESLDKESNWIKERICLSEKYPIYVSVSMVSIYEPPKKNEDFAKGGWVGRVDSDEVIIPRKFCRPLPLASEKLYIQGFDIAHLKSITEICKELDSNESDFFKLINIGEYIFQNMSNYTKSHFYFMIEHLNNKLQKHNRPLPDFPPEKY